MINIDCSSNSIHLIVISSLNYLPAEGDLFIIQSKCEGRTGGGA